MKHPKDMDAAELDAAISADNWPRGGSIALAVETWKTKRRVEVLEAAQGGGEELAKLADDIAAERRAFVERIEALEERIAALEAKRGPGRPRSKEDAGYAA